MADGGLLAWKRQSIDEHRGPATSYAGVHRPLPSPPRGMMWVHDKTTKEWSVVAKAAPIAEGESARSDQENFAKAVVVEEDSDPKLHLSKDRDYFEHFVDKTDTFQGICLRYKITGMQLRRANCFGGNNLYFAPNPLKIPINDKNRMCGGKAAPVCESLTHDQLVRNLVREYGQISGMEARAYLEINDWDYEESLKNVVTDFSFEKEEHKKALVVTSNEKANEKTAFLPQLFGK